MSEDQNRFAVVVLPHLDEALGLARWLTGNEADAEDVLQEACLRAYRGIRGFVGGNARAWVFTIVRRTAYTWLGKNRPAAIAPVEDLEGADCLHPVEVGGLGSMDPEVALIARTEQSRLRAAIRSLPFDFRETLVLREWHELDYRTIAAITEVPIGTVMSRLARARRRLIPLLQDQKP